MRVYCFALDGVDLGSPAGRMTMQVLSAVAEFERDLLIERTQAGLARAEGTQLGRRPALTDAGQADAMKKLLNGVPLSQIAREFKTSRATIQRLRRKAGQ